MTPGDAAAVDLAVLSHLAPIDLDGVLNRAELQTRVDRKYLVEPAHLDEIIVQHRNRLQVLEIDAERAFRYASVYFDTPSMESYYGSAYGRRNRFKVRTRHYVDSGLCQLEIKTRGGRSETIKERLEYGPEHTEHLTPDGHAFLRHYLPAETIATLAPVLHTTYRRSTLLSLDDEARITCDVALRCAEPGGRAVALSNHVVVETKSSHRATAIDQLLWDSGVRPVSISKYCVGLAALWPTLPANKWNRTLRRYFGWRPLGAGRYGAP